LEFQSYDKRGEFVKQFFIKNNAIGNYSCNNVLIESNIYQRAKDAFMITVAELMTPSVHTINMDTPIAQALEVCSQKKIRHLPIVDDLGELAGLVTDRDLRYCISPRIGTISENNADRESLKRPVHLIMIRNTITATPQTSIAEAAQSMLDHRVGCLVVIDPERHVIGMITSSDLIRCIAKDCH
jgi:CBS domain-containing protein